MTATADLSDCGRYRYALTRVWDHSLPTLRVVMLNPSTADATVSDATIRKVIKFAMRWGYGSIEVVNLFALRSTNPKALLTAADPIGPSNGRYLDLAATSGDVILAAWGAGVPDSWQDHARIVGRRLRAGGRCYVLGVTKDGWPRHPLYVRDDTDPVEWRELIESGAKG